MKNEQTRFKALVRSIKITDKLLEVVKEMYDFDLSDDLTVTKLDNTTISLVSNKNNFTLLTSDDGVIECYLMLKE